MQKKFGKLLKLKSLLHTLCWQALCYLLPKIILIVTASLVDGEEDKNSCAYRYSIYLLKISGASVIFPSVGC